MPNLPNLVHKHYEYTKSDQNGSLTIATGCLFQILSRMLIEEFFLKALHCEHNFFQFIL